MINFLHNSTRVEVVTPIGGVSSGDVVVTGGILGVAVTTAAAGDKVALETRGLYAQPKQAALVISEGDLVFWDAAAGEIDKTSTNAPFGICTEDAAAGDATVKCYLTDRAAVIGVTAQNASEALEAGARQVTAVVNAEAANVIAVDLALKDFNGNPVAIATSLDCELLDGSMIPEVVGAFTMAETGDGSEVSTTGKPRLVITTDANGLAQVSVTDVTAVFVGTTFLKVTPIGVQGGTAIKSSAPIMIALTFA